MTTKPNVSNLFNNKNNDDNNENCVIKPTTVSRLEQDFKAKKDTSKMVQFDKVNAIYLGVPISEHYLPETDPVSGKAILDANGRKVKSSILAGYLYTFSEYGTSKIVKVVLPQRLNVSPLNVYQISGFGYDIRSSGLIYIKESGACKAYA